MLYYLLWGKLFDFNFFNYTSDTWANANFLTVTSSTTSNTITDFDVEGLTYNPRMGISWIESGNGESIYYLQVDASATETAFSNPIKQTTSSLTAPSGFYVGGHTTVGLSHETDDKPHIFALGVQNVKLSYDGSWSEEILSVPAKPESTIFAYNSYNVSTLSQGNVYFFELDNHSYFFIEYKNRSEYFDIVLFPSPENFPILSDNIQ